MLLGRTQLVPQRAETHRGGHSDLTKQLHGFVVLKHVPRCGRESDRAPQAHKLLPTFDD